MFCWVMSGWGSSMDNLTKVCSKCGVEKPISQYWKDRYNPDGLFRYCSDCAMVLKELRRERYAARYHVGRMVRRGLLPNPKGLHCAYCGKVGCIYHHHLGYERQHWEHVTPTCRSCNQKHQGAFEMRGLLSG